MAADTALGLDVGSVVTKVVGDDGRSTLVPTPASGLTAHLARFTPGVERVGVAVPDGAGSDADLGRSLAALGIRAPVFVRGVLCAAAAYWQRQPQPVDAGVHVVCDLGARTSTVAVCAVERSGVRLLEAVHAPSPGLTFGVPGEWLAEQVILRARRSELVLGRAAQQDRYRETPVFYANGRLVTAGVVLRAVLPLAEVAGGLAAQLRTTVDDRSDLVLCGAFAASPPVWAAVITAVGQRSVVGLDAAALARGARLVAAGEVRAQADHPHTVGLAVRRIRAGRLESSILTVAEAGKSSSAAVTIEVARAMPSIPVLVRTRGEGPWRTLPAESPVPVGEYRAELRMGRTATGVLVLRPAAGGAEIECVLPDEPGPVHEEGP